MAPGPQEGWLREQGWPRGPLPMVLPQQGWGLEGPAREGGRGPESRASEAGWGMTGVPGGVAGLQLQGWGS